MSARKANFPLWTGQLERRAQPGEQDIRASDEDHAALAPPHFRKTVEPSKNYFVLIVKISISHENINNTVSSMMPVRPEIVRMKTSLESVQK